MLGMPKCELKTPAKVIASAAFLVYLGSTVPIMRVVQTLSEFPIIWLVVGLVATAGTMVTTTAALFEILRGNSTVSFIELFKLDALDFLANSVIPSRVGSFVSMPILLDRGTSLTKQEGLSIQSIQLALVGVITFIIGGTGLILLHTTFDTHVIFLLLLSLGVYAGIPAAYIVLRILPENISKYIPGIIQRISDYKVSPRNIVRAAAYQTASITVLSAIRFGSLATGVGVEMSPVLFLVLPTLMYSVTVLPVSLGGVGVAELSGVTILVFLGVDSAAATAIIFLDRAFAMYLPMVGFYILTSASPPNFEDSAIDN